MSVATRRSPVLLSRSGRHYQDVVLKDSPYLYWPMNDGLGKDRSGGGFDATLNGSIRPGRQDLPADGGAHFDGTSQYLSNASAAYATSTPITVEYWFLLASADAAAAGHTWSLGTIVAAERAQSFVAGDNKIYFDYTNDNGLNGRVSVDYAPYFNRWTHVVLRSTGVSGGASGCSITLDSKVVATATAGNPSSTKTGFLFGKHTANPDFHKGWAAHVALYKSVLTDQQVKNHYRAMVG